MWKAVSALIACCVAFPSAAATIVLNHTADLRYTALGSLGRSQTVTIDWQRASQYPQAEMPNYRFVMAGGDQAVWTIDFRGGQSISIDRLQTVSLVAFTENGRTARGTYRRGVFLDKDGNEFGQGGYPGPEPLSVPPGFSSSSMTGVPAQTRVYGVRVYFDLFDHLGSPGPLISRDPIAFHRPRLYFSAAKLQLNVIPEPHSWAMMIAGFAMAGAAMRRQTRRSVPA